MKNLDTVLNIAEVKGFVNSYLSLDKRVYDLQEVLADIDAEMVLAAEMMKIIKIIDLQRKE
jgi:hypothetical protein